MSHNLWLNLRALSYVETCFQSISKSHSIQKNTSKCLLPTSTHPQSGPVPSAYLRKWLYRIGIVKITKLLSICICCFPAGTKVHRLQPRKFVAKIFSELPRDAADSLHTWDLPSPINNNFRFSYFLREGTRNSAKMVWPLWSGLVNQQKVEWLTG